MITTDPVEEYVRTLGRQLVGPWQARRGVLDEVRDGLDDAARAMLAEGCSRADARQRAVDDFGPVADLAPEFQRELAVVQARRTATWTALLMPALWLAWDITWSHGPVLGIASPAVMVLARVTDVLGLGTALICVGALLVFELVGGRFRTPERLARAVSRLVLAGVLGVAAASVAMTTLNVQATLAVTSASTGYRLVAGVSLIAIIVVLRSAARCARAAAIEGAPDVPAGSDRVIALR